MNNCISFTILLLSLRCNANEGDLDPCESYREEDNYQRSTAYILPPNAKTMACDRPLRSAWYRFTSAAGGVIPTYCPEEYSCGTRGPVWINGSYPQNIGETKELVACARFSKECCMRRWNVQVKKCPENQSFFLIYHLTEVAGCPMAYCAGSQKKCKDDEYSPTGFTPNCTSKYPKIIKNPVVSVIDRVTGRLTFKCTVESKEKHERVRHEITWFKGTPGKQFKIDIIGGSATEAYMQNNNSYMSHPLFPLGQEIFCKVRSYYEDTPQTHSPYYTSNFFFAGFKMSPKKIYLKEGGGAQKFKLTSTVPIACDNNSTNCAVYAEIDQTNSDMVVGNCKLRFKGKRKAGQTRELEVIALRDFVNDGDQVMFIKIKFPTFFINVIDFNYYGGYIIVKVITKDVKTARCRTTGDPHINTFDGLHYHHFMVGDYVLTESKARKFTVHARTRKCKTGSCECGVAVREGDDVVIIDMCRDNVPRARFASTVNPQAALERNENGDGFQVNLPSGAYVSFTVNTYAGTIFGDIVVQVPPDDYQKTVGLCGTFDKNITNEGLAKNEELFPISPYTTAHENFTKSWKIPVGDSLFYYRGGKKKCNVTRTSYYCQCVDDSNTTKANCNFHNAASRPKYKQGNKTWKGLTFPGAEFCGRRKRRSLNDDMIILPDDGDADIYIYDPVPLNSSQPTFPTATGKTEESAQNTCNKTIRNTFAGRTCMNTIRNFDIQEYINQCVFDVCILDDYRPATQSAIRAMTDECEESTLREKNKYWKEDSSGNLAPPPEIGNSLCPNECSKNGLCINGTCICNEDFITADCSLKKGQIPVLRDIANDGLCDLRRQDCYRTRVIGKGFIDSANLKCKMTEAKVTETSSPIKTKLGVTTKGQLLSFREISCHIPNIPTVINGNPSKSSGKPTGAFYIKAANDGSKFSSDEVLIIVYDSRCMECTKKGTRTCNLKVNTCKINGYCFSKNDANPNNWCEVCDPKRNTEAFVKRIVNKPPIFADVPTLYAFKGQTWKHKITARDPEFRPVKYTIVGQSYGMRLSSAGIITWIPSESKVYKFTLKAEDPCGLNASKQLLVDVKACSCEEHNGAKCAWINPLQPDNRSYCICPVGCKGKRCMEAMDGMTCNIQEKKISMKKRVSNSLFVALPVMLCIIVVFAVNTLIVFIWKKKAKTNKQKQVTLLSYQTRDNEILISN